MTVRPDRSSVGDAAAAAGSIRLPLANRSVARALAILELLGNSDGALSLGEIASREKLPKSSALSLLRALVTTEFCTVDSHGRYALGVRTFEVGAAYLRSMTPVRSVEPELRWLTRSLGVTSHFAVLDGDEVVYLAKFDPPEVGLKLASSLGARLPASLTAVGKAQLAYRSAPCPALGAPSTDAVDDRLPPSGALDEELREVRARGYAVDDGATATAIRCVAAPLFNDHDCCGAIGVSYLLGERPVESEVSRALLEATRRASERLGGRIGNGRCE